MSRNNKISITQEQIVLLDQLRHHRNRYRNQEGAIEQTVDDGDSSDDCVGGDGVGAVMTTMIQQSRCHLEQLTDIQA
jgi:inorganic pyrophosphatase